MEDLYLEDLYLTEEPGLKEFQYLAHETLRKESPGYYITNGASEL